MAVATRPPADAAPGDAPALPAGEDAPMALPDGRGAGGLGGALFVVADTMALAGLVAVWLTVRGNADTWPPKGTHPGVYVPVVIAITALMAAASAQWSVAAATADDRRNALVSLAMTAGLLGAIVNIQTYAYTKLPFAASKNAYATLHYALTGFHLANAVLAIAMLVVAFARVAAGHVHSGHDGPVRAAARFAQWVNFTWFVVLTVIYVFH